MKPVVVQLLPDAMDRLMPMHLILGPTGHIVHAGPAFARLFGAETAIGKRALEILHLVRPRNVWSIEDLRGLAGQPLHFTLREDPSTRLKGIVVADAGGPKGQMILNLSFGISVVEAVGRYDLTNADFAPTDLAVELLYLVEAQSAAMHESRKLTERLEGAKNVAEEQALTDTLTGLKNRRALDAVFQAILANGAPFSLMHLDLDHFKAVNDTLGHAAGDAILVQAAAIMADSVRADDVIARVGGDEFVLLFKGLTRKSRLLEISQKLIARLEEPVRIGTDEARISGSIGITVSTLYKRPDALKMQEDADIALYASKRQGRGRATLYGPHLRNPSQDEAARTPPEKRKTAGTP